jgi:hypothetical protein
LSVAILLGSCEIYNPAEPVPAYIHIDKIDLITAIDGTQGTNSHKITDAWVYIDEDLIGCFELPATFPVLYEGSHQVKIRAGIKVNGMSGIRNPYPFYDFYSQVVDFQKTKTVTLTPTVKYKTTAIFDLLENFENVGMLIDTTSKSLTTIQKISSPPENVFEGSNAVVTYLDASTRTFFECSTINKYTLPKGGADIFLEFNYKCNYHFTVSVIAYGSGTSEQFSVLNFNPSAGWNKAYVYLTPAVSGAYTATNYKIAWGTANSTGNDSIAILFDNIKLVH